MCDIGGMKDLPNDPEELKDIIRSLESQTKAWWDIRTLHEGELKNEVLDTVKGYLRVSRSGGMPSEESDMVENVVSGALNDIVVAVWPILLRIADMHKNDLVVPEVLMEKPPSSSFEYLENVLSKPDTKDNSMYSTLLYLYYLMNEERKRP